MTFVFVHIPKTAGTSFRSGLKARFRGQMAYDYPDKRASSPAIFEEMHRENGPLEARVERVVEGLREEQTKVLCGHFHARRYWDHFPAQSFITFLRSPVARTLSNFNHLRTRRRLQMPLERYASGPGKNLQSRLLEGVEPQAFCLVGITEFYSQSLELFECRTGIRLPNRWMNRAGSWSWRFRRKAPPTPLTPEAEAFIREHNQQDEDFYNEALERFKRDYPREVGGTLPRPETG